MSRELDLEQVIELGRHAKCVMQPGVGGGPSEIYSYTGHKDERGPVIFLTRRAAVSIRISPDRAPRGPWHHDDGCDCRLCTESPD